MESYIHYRKLMMGHVGAEDEEERKSMESRERILLKR